MTVFVGYFMKGQHIKAKLQGNSNVDVTGKLCLIFESLYRQELEFTPPYVNISFFTLFMKKYLKQSNGCAINIIN